MNKYKKMTQKLISNEIAFDMKFYIHFCFDKFCAFFSVCHFTTFKNLHNNNKYCVIM